ncbi:hypothetical protein HYFRA_00014160 [Hymenoscyphus fraxineus]|uniref:BTB domain-containing protein n=1 Tax=Hymenoscyphus fraxineus TaxID=746836 RepID=A0A9N9Q0P8_9HELO|nr:hypothetical protein HYFRA_00014160 [Hymenoscyphus fraxineus]
MTSHTSEPGSAPIVFPILGLKPDVHLQVFNQAFHVHSLCLKTHSEFFRKFLDSPEKAGSTSSMNSEFAYNWVTQIDEDGTWSLVSTEALHQTPTAKLAGTPSLHVEAFCTLLQAMYNSPIVIYSFDHLIKVTALADYYRCLPTLSVAVSASLCSSPSCLTINLPENSLELLDVAAKLRNKVLFKECLIYLVGSFHETKYRSIQNKTLRCLAEQAHRSLKLKIAELHFKTLDMLADSDPRVHDFYNDLGAFSMALTWTTKDHMRRAQLPRLYKALLEKLECEGGPTWYCLILESALKSNLRLNTSAQAGVGKFEDTFLCAEISDDMLPWDVNEIAW